MSSYQGCFAALVFIFMLWLPSVSAAYGVKRAPSGNDIRWRGHDVTLRIDPALERLLDADQVRSAAVMASEAWRGFGNTPDIAIEAGEPPAYDASNRGNGIYLLPRWAFDPRQLATTVSTFGNDGELLGVDVLVNGEQPFALFTENQAAMGTNSYDIAAVLTHELGHVLGLDESYEHPEATMFPQIGVGETHQRVLSADDQQGAVEIYSTPMAAAKVGCSVSEPGATTRGGTLAAVVVGLGGLFGARTRRRSRAHVA
jgi:MYXO-CTERM domain-containing protein